MAGRVAIVTGGTRGIGAAVSRMLKDKGYKVAATYAGNDAAAQKFKAETGIAVYKFDVGDFAACQSVIACRIREVVTATARISPKTRRTALLWGPSFASDFRPRTV